MIISGENIYHAMSINDGKARELACYNWAPTEECAGGYHVV